MQDQPKLRSVKKGLTRKNTQEETGRRGEVEGESQNLGIAEAAGDRDLLNLPGGIQDSRGDRLQSISPSIL